MIDQTLRHSLKTEFRRCPFLGFFGKEIPEFTIVEEFIDCSDDRIDIRRIHKQPGSSVFDGFLCTSLISPD